MNSTLKLAMATIVLSVTCVPIAQASLTNYTVQETFFEPAYAGSENTIFNGSFTYDSSTQQITNLTGTLSEAMTGMMNGGKQTLLNLSFDPVSSSSDGSGGIKASAFLLNTTAIYSMGGTYNSTAAMKDASLANAYITIDVSADQLNGTAISLATSNFGNLFYGDCTPGGMMGPMCMTGWGAAGNAGSMGGYPISEVVTMTSAVPLPPAAWSFLTSLLGLLFVGKQRKNLLTSC
ncbi:hypothetical protein [Methylomonas sp. AM2-LC]|uniref:hypothetical protein n=1 Tax=Methylomonas sp. AM2-LC TaxID=3153301 RepID=UPI00326586B3